MLRSRLMSLACTAISLVLASLATPKSIAGQTPVSAEKRHPEVPDSGGGAVILILGDSLSLCGFGKRLDEHFRKTPEVATATFTYMACGTNPLSWLKDR